MERRTSISTFKNKKKNRENMSYLPNKQKIGNLQGGLS